MNYYKNYIDKLHSVLDKQDWKPVERLALSLQEVWKLGKQVFLCGNGGSAANAIHFANDLIFGVAKEDGKGIKACALPANPSVLTCLANDISYEDIFSHQLGVLAQQGDILIVYSGSGNSPNVVKAIEKAKEMGIKTFAILGYSGGKCLELADVAIHFPIDDMQISEDCQQIVGHMLMRWLAENGKGTN